MITRLFTMLIILITALTLSAQSKVGNISKTSIPKDLLGHWQKGVFSLTSFEELNGKYVGPANETSVSYVIAGNGIAKEYFITNTNSYNCRLQILGFREGKIVFNNGDNSYEFQPVSGYYNMVSCMSKGTKKKNYSSSDLYPDYKVKLFLKKDENGANVLISENSKGSNAITLKRID